jgi:hypothetical protein
MITRPLFLMIVLALLVAACTKESQTEDHNNPENEVPETVFMADTGVYVAINTQITNYGPKYTLEELRLQVLNDTLRLGVMRLLPTSSTEANILPFPVSIQKMTSNGYPYQVEGIGTGTLSVKGNNVQANIKKVALDQSVTVNDVRTFFNGNPSATPLTRADYTGQYQGFFTNFSQQGNSITVTVEPLPGTENGVWLKELNRHAHIDETGNLVLPEMPLDSAVYGASVRYAPAQTRLQGRLLQFGQQTVYGNQPPAPNDHRLYTLLKK